MKNKSLAEWTEEAYKYYTIYNDKYLSNYNNILVDNKTIARYRKVAYAYQELFRCLKHITSYGKTVNSDKCVACRYSKEHVLELRKTYDKYSKFIERKVNEESKNGGT